MSEAQGKPELDGMVNEYLRDLENALAMLEPSHRVQLVDEIRQHIAELRSVQQVRNSSEMKNLLDQVGSPGDIAAAAMEDGDDGLESKSRPRGKVALGAIAAIGAAVTVALVLFLTLGSSTPQVPPAEGHQAQTTATYTIPSVIDMSQAQAVAALEAAGFRSPEIRNVSSHSIPPGLVTTQSPRAGTQVERGGKVSLSISVGPSGSDNAIGTVVMLNVFGQSQAQVGAELSSLGLNYTVHNAPSTSTPIGRVIATNPTAGSKVPSGSTISITVSTGPVS
jgi:hypothetical protein